MSNWVHSAASARSLVHRKTEGGCRCRTPARCRPNTPGAAHPGHRAVWPAAWPPAAALSCLRTRTCSKGWSTSCARCTMFGSRSSTATGSSWSWNLLRAGHALSGHCCSVVCLRCCLSTHAWTWHPPLVDGHEHGDQHTRVNELRHLLEYLGWVLGPREQLLDLRGSQMCARGWPTRWALARAPPDLERALEARTHRP